MTSLKKIAGLAAFQFERVVAAADLAFRRRRVSGSDLEAEAEHWGISHGAGWQDLAPVRAAINRRVSGDPGINWLEAFARDFGRGFELGLNLGCGTGGLEAHALSLGLCRRFHSFDLSPAALEQARARLPAEVELFRADLNQIQLEPGSYDVAFAASSLHHLSELPAVLDQVRAALKPGGWFVFDEFVGPSRFQWCDHQLEAINAILAALPQRLVRDPRGLRPKRRVYRRPPDGGLDSPFEAIRSEEILPLTAERFEIVRRRDYGGAILHPLLDGIAENFRPELCEDDRLLGRLIETEATLEARGEIGSDFTSVVARRPA